jgi:5-formyltetrahydrofolate cyclo-ligase
VQTQPEAADLSAMAAIDAAAIAGAKRTLRKAVQFRRDLRTSQQRARDDASRMSLIESALADRIPDTVAAYFPTAPSPAHSNWLRGWRHIEFVSCCRCSRTRLVAVSTSLRGRHMRGRIRCASGRYSILEPTGEVVPSEQLPEAELIICPGFAANLHGDRLGRGAGWYDRALRHASQSAPVWMLLNDDEVWKPSRACLGPSRRRHRDTKTHDHL